MRKSADTAYVEAVLDEWVGKNICRESMIGSCPPDFPYAAVISAYHENGKHFVAPSLLSRLAELRACLSPAGGDAEAALLGRFLSVALDKWDETYDYQSYLGLSLLELSPDADGATGQQERATWAGLFLADSWQFERAALNGTSELLPILRPSPEAARKRLRRTAGILRLGTPLPSDCPLDDDAALARAALDLATPRQRRILALTMQPVYVVHDEYFFIRVLQAHEVTFAAMAASMRDAIGAVRRNQPAQAADSVLNCGRTLAGARDLFSLLATMQPESFRAFRVYTVGASAIQSGHYKTFEALCSPPAPERLDSPAFESVPAVRDRLQRDWDDFTTVLRNAVSIGRMDPSGLRLILGSVAELEKVHQHWKRTHWKLASRMIGEARGTGYTVGVPYLKEVIANSLFRHLPEAPSPAATQGDRHAPA